ncbi:hypothetical protein QQF64_014654 [Cirrhinus molitorella]|uniref:Uncharacterized protein n=1 Tax=Cirrhinus molitorella TaxID=172907 RepID=A0ABR3NSX2_9TELE
MEDVVTPIKAKLRSLEKLIRDIGECAEDLENIGRRKNIHIVGLHEGVEGRVDDIEVRGLARLKVKWSPSKLENT